MTAGMPAGMPAGRNGRPHARDTHWIFPLRLDDRGRTRLADRERWLAGLVEQVLFTRPGERVNRPHFGTGLLDLVFEPLDAALADTTTALVAGALQAELGDLLRVEEVEVTVEDTTVHVRLRYQSLDLPAGESRFLTVSGDGGTG